MYFKPIGAYQLVYHQNRLPLIQLNWKFMNIKISVILNMISLESNLTRIILFNAYLCSFISNINHLMPLNLCTHLHLVVKHFIGFLTLKVMRLNKIENFITSNYCLFSYYCLILIYWYFGINSLIVM